MDDLWRLRIRRDAFLAPDPDLPGGGPPAFVGRVTSTGADLGAGLFCAVTPATLSGAETEREAAEVADLDGPVLAYPLGPVAPETGDVVICRRVNYRWVFEKGTPAGHGPPLCPATVHLADCDGSAISGATITIDDFPRRTPPRAPITAATDAGGDYTFPENTPTGLDNRNFWTFTHDGLTTGLIPVPGLSRWNCTNTLNYCYSHARLTVTTPAGADATIDTPSGWSVESSSAGSVTFAYKQIAECSSPSMVPGTVGLHALPADPTQYLDNCTATPVACGDDLAVDLPMLDYATDYAYWFDAFCDEGCDAVGEGPNYRGLVPKALVVTFNAIDGGTGGEFAPGDAYFGSYANTPIPITWNGSYWDSGCLPAAIPCSPGSPYSPLFASARVTLTYVNGQFLLTFTAYADGACTPGAGSGACSPDRSISFQPSRCGLTSPVDGLAIRDDGLGFYFKAHITE